MNYKSPLTGSENTEIIYTQYGVPLFQNKVFDSEKEAISINKTDVILTKCLDTGFVFSGGFDITKLEYDKNYQNEQANSRHFVNHLNQVIDLLEKNNTLNGKILEIGCGKGFFMDMLQKKGCDVIGIDPTYEGKSDRIILDYYSEKYSYLNADLIILRHTLEHIPLPFEFIKMIAKANNYKGKIYIEIPTFDWIVNNSAVEDIFYEHCNYFTPHTISLLFNSSKIEYLFGNQYQGIIANLADVRDDILPQVHIENFELNFENKLNEYRLKISHLPNLAIWGAGAKGSTFLNLLDKNKEFVKYVVDLNPQKQNKYIGGTGHRILSANEINDSVDNILVMNKNYLKEIQSIINPKIKTITL